MTTIEDSSLFSHSRRVKGKVVLITGAANGIGKDAALKFASYGAKVVIGDLDSVAGSKVVEEIQSNGGEALYQRCNVVEWDDVVALFEEAISTYGVVDVVVPNAGITEVGQFNTVLFANGRPQKPNSSTIDVNLTGAMYTAHLAQHYLTVGRTAGDWKAIVFVGSMASWVVAPGGTLYTASKHAVLGLMRAMYRDLTANNIRVAIVHPWYAETNILPTAMKVLLAGIPLAPLSRIGGAIFYATTNPEPETSGCVWLVPDDGPLVLLAKEDLTTGVYDVLNRRIDFIYKSSSQITHYVRFAQDATRLLGKKRLAISSITILVLVVYFRVLGRI